METETVVGITTKTKTCPECGQEVKQETRPHRVLKVEVVPIDGGEDTIGIRVVEQSNVDEDFAPGYPKGRYYEHEGQAIRSSWSPREPTWYKDRLYVRGSWTQDTDRIVPVPTTRLLAILRAIDAYNGWFNGGDESPSDNADEESEDDY
jgi:hypothetical protein